MRQWLIAAIYKVVAPEHTDRNIFLCHDRRTRIRTIISPHSCVQVLLCCRIDQAQPLIELTYINCKCAAIATINYWWNRQRIYELGMGLWIKQRLGVCSWQAKK